MALGSAISSASRATTCTSSRITLSVMSSRYDVSAVSISTNWGHSVRSREGTRCVDDDSLTLHARVSESQHGTLKAELSFEFKARVCGCDLAARQGALPAASLLR